MFGLKYDSKINLISPSNFTSTLSFDQIQLMDSKIEYTNPISAPIIKNQEYGKLIITIQGKPQNNNSSCSR